MEKATENAILISLQSSNGFKRSKFNPSQNISDISFDVTLQTEETSIEYYNRNVREKTQQMIK